MPTIETHSHITWVKSGLLPTVDQLFERHLNALGGRVAVSLITSVVERGMDSINGKRKDFVLYRKAPNKFALVYDAPDTGPGGVGYDGRVAWSTNPENGMIDDLTGKELDTVKLEAIFFPELRIREIYRRLTLTAKSILVVDSSKPITGFVVDAESDAGIRTRFYFDSETHLIVYELHETADSPPKFIERYFDDFRIVSDVKIPFLLELGDDEGSFLTYKMLDVKCNIPLADSLFSKPSNASELKGRMR